MRDVKVYDLEVRSGESIKDAISAYILEKGWENVYISGAIGSVIDCSFTAPIENELPLRTASTPCRDAGELVSFVGEVMKRERMDPALAAVYKDSASPLFIHIHAGVATAGGRVMGGGLADGKAFRAVRVFMIPLEDRGD